MNKKPSFTIYKDIKVSKILFVHFCDRSVSNYIYMYLDS